MSIGLSSVGRIRKECCKCWPDKLMGSVMLPVVAAAVPLARWICASSVVSKLYVYTNKNDLGVEYYREVP